MADERTTAEPTDQTRVGRYERSRRARRFRLLAAAAVVVVLLIVGALFAGRWYGSTLSAPPAYLVVVGESVLEDGTKTAGVVTIVRRSGDSFSVEPVDAGKEQAVPGTSFARLSDALAMGGPALVARLVADDIDGAEEPAWLLLEQPGWSGVLQASGDTPITVEESTTAFTGETLYRLAPGDTQLSGDEVAALLLAAESFEETASAQRTRITVSQALGEAVAGEPQAVLEALGEGLGEFSGSDRQLRNFFER